MHRPRQSLRRPSTLAALVGLVSVAALAGACGGPAEDAEPLAEPAPAVSVPGDLTMSGAGGEETTKSAAATDDEGTGSESDAEASESPSASPSPDAEGEDVDPERCALMQEAWSSTNRALVQLDASAGHPRTLVESFRAGNRAMTSAEPTEGVATAWGTMSDYLGAAVDAFEDVDEDDADAVSSAMADAVTADDTAEAAAAGQEVTEYLATTCSAG
ncbi:hypothetical protein [Isoptericola sp. BMS4]|uniref:hypothetical protein n=1 Tax=Isoptericola sp. BMS4 TaxID=2527875 RepID=UPI001421E143|nr:hypothetical protein [Isoptericola sp. BMS4]